MEPVKVTDIKEWSAIDIFLFSNGQQYSPPRKYHLRSEELQWWGSTISYLGRTQYGAGHSTIELYAINGTKINGPLELIDGAAYVAVEPPDSFINTGYEEYLLKASRSWEKRLAQKSNNTETSNLDFKCEKDPAVESKADNLNALENNIDAAPLKVSSNAITSLQKNRLTKAYQRPQRKSITSPTQIQKKKSFDTQGAIIKRLCAEKDKLIACPNKPTIRKNINQKPSKFIPCKPNEKLNQEPPACCKKRDSIKPEYCPKNETSNNLNASNTTPINESQAIDLYENNESESMSVKNDTDPNSRRHQSINHNEPNILNEDKGNTIEKFINSTKNKNNKPDFENDSSNKLKEINEYETNYTTEIYNDSKSNIEKDRQDNVPVISATEENKSHDYPLNSRSEKQVIDEYVAHMSKGGLLLLKLKVKLKGCKTIINKDKSKNIPRTTSLSNLPETEKTSQVDINISFSGELLKSTDQLNNQDKSLQSLLNKLCSEQTDRLSTKNPRIIVLQCACRNYSDNNKSCTCDTFEGYDGERRNCEPPLNQKLNETLTRCDCHNESLRTSKDETCALKNTTTFQSVKDVDNKRFSLSNGTRVKDLAQKFEMSDRTVTNDKNTNNNYKQITDRTPMHENQRQQIVLRRIFGSETENSIENVPREQNSNGNSKIVCNKSTQTDWNNVLLEARLHEDDKYTFHLPSLYFLKQCNL